MALPGGTVLQSYMALLLRTFANAAATRRPHALPMRSGSHTMRLLTTSSDPRSMSFAVLVEAASFDLAERLCAALGP